MGRTLCAPFLLRYPTPSFNRPGFTAMINRIKAGKINCVIVKDLSRFGRNWIETGRYVEQIFPLLGVRFIAITDAYDSAEACTANDSILLPFKNLLNDAYARDISVKVRSQLEAKRRSGDFVGAFAVYGYKKDPVNHNRLVLDEEAAAAVRDIFKWRIDGLSNQVIARRLEDLGVASPYEHKRAKGGSFQSGFKKGDRAAWSAAAIGRILANPIYIGILEQGKCTSISYKIRHRVRRPKEEWARIEGAVPAIVSSEDFQLAKALQLQDLRTPPGKEGLYTLSGLLICSHCGQNMVRKLVPAGGKKYAYYVCGTNKRGDGCLPHSISEKALENAVFCAVKAQFDDKLDIEKFLKHIGRMPFGHEIKRLDNQIHAKESELEKIKQRKLRLYEDLQDGTVDEEEFELFGESFDKQASKSAEALVYLEAERKNAAENGTASQQWIDFLQTHRTIETLDRGLAVRLISHVNIYGKNQIEIRFNFADVRR